MSYLFPYARFNVPESKEVRGQPPFKYPEFVNWQVIEQYNTAVAGTNSFQTVPDGKEMWVTSVWGSINPTAASVYGIVRLDQALVVQGWLFRDATNATTPKNFSVTYPWPVYIEEGFRIGNYLNVNCTICCVGFTGWMCPKSNAGLYTDV